MSRAHVTRVQPSFQFEGMSLAHEYILVLSNNSPASKTINLALVHPEMVSQHLVRVLAQGRRNRPHAGTALRELDWRVHHFDGPAVLVVQLDNHVPGSCVLELERGLDVVDGGVRHSLALEHSDPLFSSLSDRYPLDLRLKLVPMRHSIGIDLILGVLFPFRPP